MSDIRMHDGCSACGGSDLSVTTRGTLIEIACSICGHIEDIINARPQLQSLRVQEAILGTLQAEGQEKDEETW
jgi:hypothetical protein